LCACSDGLDKVTVEPNAYRHLSVTFRAPPIGTPDVDLIIPSFDRLDDVPIS
jgi:hypothetical protein